MPDRPPGLATPAQPLDALRQVHQSAASAWAAVMAAVEVGLRKPLSFEFGYTPPGDDDPVDRAVGAVEAAAARSVSFPYPDPFAGDAIVLVAGVEGTSGHAVCHTALARCAGAMSLAMAGRSPILPAGGEPALPGLLSYLAPEYVAYDLVSLDPYGSPLGRRDNLIQTCRGLICRFRGLDVLAGEPHARVLRAEARTRMSMLLEVEWNRAAARLPSAAGGVSAAGDPGSQGPDAPEYDADTGLLRVGTYEKRFKTSATRTRKLLAEFEHRGWKDRVPAVRVGGDAITLVKDLNTKHLAPACPIEFDTEHNGVFFIWRWKPPG